MPHVSIEFSEGLEQGNDMQSVCQQLFVALSAQDAFDDPSTIKIRAKPVKFYSIGGEIQTFVHVTLLLMAGRHESTRAHLNRTIMETLDAALPGLGSITVQEVEMTRATYMKRVLQTRIE